MTTASDRAAALRAALAIAEEEEKAELDAARLKRYQEAREKHMRKVDAIREENFDFHVGDYSAWMGVKSDDYSAWMGVKSDCMSEGCLEITIFGWSQPKHSMTMNQDELRDYIAKLSGMVK